MNETNFLKKGKEKIRIMKGEGIDLFPNNVGVLTSIKDLILYTKKLDIDKTKNTHEFSIAGRVMSINNFGKSSFFKLKNEGLLFQSYIQKKVLGELKYGLFKRLDVGDFVKIKGELFKTKTKEWTIFVKNLQLISKSMRPLPEKFHGLKDQEKRYRHRHLDLIMNQNTRDVFIKRSKIIQKIRSFFIKKNFLEVETPMMHAIPGGAEASPFKTYHNALNMNLYLRIAPELYLKRLIIGGLEKIFEINRSFRNEGLSTQHNPEFTMLEFYQAYATYEDLIILTKEMLKEIAVCITGSSSIKYQGNIIDFKKEWERFSMKEALVEIGKLNSIDINKKDSLIEFAKENEIELTKTDRYGKILSKLFDVLVEPKLIQPTFITEYPLDISPLSKKNSHNNKVADRFELFVGGREIANGFSELNDPEEQKSRFLEQAEHGIEEDYDSNKIDYDYIEAMEYGMPPTAGEGIGIDRLVMLFTDSPSIKEVILFPSMKKKNKC